jgi:ATP/maltotriose-dependent transcriptional regulator MalT
VGRYRTAARWLAPSGEPAGSLAASCLASHLRQVGRHTEAEPLDRLALSTAADPEARADALIGLVADAVGRHEPALARQRLDVATQWIVAVTSDHTQWRVRVRLEWVTAETALLAGDAARAVEIGRTAQRISRTASAYRHTVKSTLVLGVALDAAGRTRAAARVLRTASRGASRLGLIPLLTPIHAVLAGILQDRAPLVAARERLRADAAQSIREDPAERQSFR